MDFHGLPFKLDQGKRMPYSPLNYPSRAYSTLGSMNYHQNNVMNMTKNVCDLISNLSGTHLMASHTKTSVPIVGSSKVVSCDAFSFSDVVRGVMGTRAPVQTNVKPPNEINNLFGIMGQFVQIFDVPNIQQMREPTQKSNPFPREGVTLKSTIDVIRQVSPCNIENGQTHLSFNSSGNGSQLVKGVTMPRRSYAEVTKEKPSFPRRFQTPLNDRTMPQSIHVECYTKPPTPHTLPSVVIGRRDSSNPEEEKPVCPLQALVKGSSPVDAHKETDVKPNADESVNDRLHLSSISSESDISDSILDVGRRRIKRTVSECSVDSDDSFIVFEEDGDGKEEVEWSDECDSSDESDCENSNDLLSLFEDDSCNDCSEKAVKYNSGSEEELQDDNPELNLAEVNERWNSYYPDDACVRRSSPKVKFAEGKKLVAVRPLVTWSYAHHTARIGHWIQLGRDMERFKEKISSIAKSLNQVLTPDHRQRVYNERFKPLSDAFPSPLSSPFPSSSHVC